jgi:hypothetical protein
MEIAYQYAHLDTLLILRCLFVKHANHLASIVFQNQVIAQDVTKLQSLLITFQINA